MKRSHVCCKLIQELSSNDFPIAAAEQDRLLTSVLPGSRNRRCHACSERSTSCYLQLFQNKSGVNIIQGIGQINANSSDPYMTRSAVRYQVAAWQSAFLLCLALPVDCVTGTKRSTRATAAGPVLERSRPSSHGKLRETPGPGTSPYSMP